MMETEQEKYYRMKNLRNKELSKAIRLIFWIGIGLASIYILYNIYWILRIFVFK